MTKLLIYIYIIGYIFRIRDRFVKLKMVRSILDSRTYHMSNQIGNQS